MRAFVEPDCVETRYRELSSHRVTRAPCTANLVPNANAALEKLHLVPLRSASLVGLFERTLVVADG